MASTWFADGTVSGYDATTGTFDRNQFKLIMASPGPVNTNGITRLQYTLAPDKDTRVRAMAPIRVDYDDYFFAQSRGNDITVQMFVAPQSALALENPSTNDIIIAAGSQGLIYRSTTWATDVPPPVGGFRNMYFYVDGPTAQIVSDFASAKFWVLLIPVEARKTDAPNSVRGYLSSYTAVQAKGVSLWRNRTPLAPAITSPINNSVFNANADFPLTITSTDPDAVFGDTNPMRTDYAGVQVQYAPRPSQDVPSPAWTDLPFATAAAVLAKGWYIAGSTSNVAGESLNTLRTTLSIPVRVGSQTPAASKGLLPSGTWQLRVRVFDFGHPWPGTVLPLGRTNGDLAPGNYPATNTSPWSEPVTVTVSAQVPQPLLMSPVGSAAVPAGVVIPLTWQYRNTASPPFAQAQRTVQIRAAGETAWTTVATGAGSSPVHSLDANFGVAGTEYEWRVQVRDTDNSLSNWSEIGRFWVVPAPSSGGVRPVPSGTIAGATLGCGTHRVMVYRRGGLTFVGEISQLVHVDWSRVRDDISTAKIVIQGWGIDCGKLLARLHCWAYEIVIFRNNGFGMDRVWEGPITLLTFEQDSVTIHAKDVMVYPYRRIIRQAMNDAKFGDTVTSRAARALQSALAPDDPNVLAYLTVLSKADDARETRSAPPYSRTAFEEVDDMASNAGLDYTAVGRAILLWGTKHRIGTLPTFTDSDLGATPIVSEYGMSMANRYVVSDGNGVWGAADRLGVSGNDEDHGLVEMLSSTWATDTEAVDHSASSAATAIETFEGYAERSIADRYMPGPPVVVRIPDNTSLNPSASVSIQHLVPGVVIPLQSTGTLRKVTANQKLDSVKVVEEEGKETITITLSPFSRDDAEMVEGEGEV